MHATGDSDRLRRHRIIIIGSVAIAVFVLIAAAGVGGSAILALNARDQALTALRQAVAAEHNHNEVSVQQACTHWSLIYSGTTGYGMTSLHKAVGRVLGQLGCSR